MLLSSEAAEARDEAERVAVENKARALLAAEEVRKWELSERERKLQAMISRQREATA